MIEKRPPGTPPGVIKNPKGINQYTGMVERGKSLSCRLPIDLDTEFRQAIRDNRTTATIAIREAIELWLENLNNA